MYGRRGSQLHKPFKFMIRSTKLATFRQLSQMSPFAHMRETRTCQIRFSNGHRFIRLIIEKRETGKITLATFHEEKSQFNFTARSHQL